MLEKSKCKALFLKMEDDVNGVTFCKQVLGQFVYDVQKLCEWFGQETHEGIMSWVFKIRNDTKMELLCNLWLEGV